MVITSPKKENGMFLPTAKGNNLLEAKQRNTQDYISLPVSNIITI